ncbi:MAG TPA: tetratricopeptide repeat protein [Polyangiaceae bacterium]|nr:tetratricopeptide repeat protein [Polyangiaceae bacterium]
MSGGQVRASIAVLTLVAAVGALTAGCGASLSKGPVAPSLAELRSAGRSSNDAEVVGRWTLAEALAPGGTAAQVAVARKRLDATSLTGRGMWASLAKGVVDEAHGDPGSAATAFLGALTAASADPAAQAPLVAWFSARQLLALRGSVANLFARNRAAVDGLVTRPGHIGWRAVAELEDWHAAEVYAAAEQTPEAYDADVVRRMGCATGVRIAGPFGHGAPADVGRSFAPEKPGRWPPAWAPDPLRGSTPHVLSVRQTRCLAEADEQVQEGVFYVESYFTTRSDAELLLAVQGAVAVWVDGVPVLSRGPQEWGSWQRFGSHVAVSDGRHRVIARTLNPATSVRLLNADGTPAGLASDGDPGPPTTVDPARVLDDPNPIEPYVRSAAGGDASFAADPVASALAAYGAHVDQMDDVASTLIGPIVDGDDAAPMALEMASAFVASDAAYPEDARAPRARALRARALAKDGLLWRARLMTIVDDAEQRGPAEAVEPLRALAEKVPAEPEMLEQLALLYGRLGWHGDRMRALADLAQRFPDDVGALHAYLEALEEDGPAAEADRVAARIKKLDPDAEVDLDRSLARHDYPAAIAELNRLKTRRPDRKETAARIADVLARSGDPSAAAAELEKALAKHPRDVAARFRLADLAYAKGDRGSLRRALAAALQAGAGTDELRAAIDVVEGATDLEPYRKDGRAVIREYQAWEKAGHHMDGTAARVLDYSAVWVHDDGSSEMLEHEIQKLQSQEAINAESETEPPSGLVLRLRVIKPDGKVLEPEPVQGKPTLTLPHLEVGDFIELEHITAQAGDGAHGKEYHGPLWFFREADKGYWQSEFVVVTPANRALQVEARGAVPPPQVKPLGTFVERRWRVDLSPPAEVEPESPPVTEFLPSVRVGWGTSLDGTLGRLVDLASDETPLDPRLRAKAQEIVHGVAARSTDERARLVYRWVLDHVQESKDTHENDGRRVVTGGSGSRQAAFRYLLRLLGIDCELALAKNGLAAPALGKMSEVEQYDALVLRVTTDKGVRWLTVHDKFAPFGYTSAELRDQPAVVLVEGTPRDVVRAPGAVDRVAYEGHAEVRDDGSATFDLALTFEGNRAIAWRNAFDQIPQAKIDDFVEREVVQPSFDGGHVREMKVDSTALDQPLVMHLKVEVPQFAKAVVGGLSLRPPFLPNLAQLAALPSRHTPILRRGAWHADVRVRVTVPDSFKVPADMTRGQEHSGDARVTVRDAVSAHTIDFDREIDVPAGRVQPGDEYATWQKFVRDADTLLSHDVTVSRDVAAAAK